MKISEMIQFLTEDLEENGDREIVIYTDGNRYEDLEFYSDDEYELYLEGYEREIIKTSFVYKGKEYPARIVEVPDYGEMTIGVLSLEEALGFFRDNSEPYDDEAGHIDNQIFYYVEDEMIDYPNLGTYVGRKLK